MDIINLIMFANFKNYLLQDISRRFNNNDFLHCLLHYYRIPAFKILINYRLGQYISKNGGVSCLLSVDSTWKGFVVDIMF